MLCVTSPWTSPLLSFLYFLLPLTLLSTILLLLPHFQISHYASLQSLLTLLFCLLPLSLTLAHVDMPINAIKVYYTVKYCAASLPWEPIYTCSLMGESTRNGSSSVQAAPTLLWPPAEARESPRLS